MAHRGRSKTVDSADSKKTKTNPRRLTEKIAIIKQREHEQSEAFEQAMQSIFEMQQARIHSGGGSMPSLQAIDSTPPAAPSIDMQSIFKDFNEMRRRSGVIIDRPQSGGRRIPIARTASMETDTYSAVGLNNSDHYWNASTEWIEGDLARHKSDSDLQQSLLIQQQSSPQHLGSPQHSRNFKLTPPGDLYLRGNKKRPNSATTHALLSPDQYIGSPECHNPPPLVNSVGTASSLPDLTNIEFSSGLDVPLERDEPFQDHQSLASSQISSILLSPTNKMMPGPSKLISNSFQAPHYSPQGHSDGPGFAPGLGMPYQHNSSSPGPVSSGSLCCNQFPPMMISGGISRSPTMPEFRTIHSTNGYVPRLCRPSPLPPPQYKPILPSLPPKNQPHTFHQLPTGLPNFLPHVGVLQGHVPLRDPQSPFTIIIQPPPTSSAVNASPPQTQQPVSSQPVFQQPDLAHEQQQPQHIQSNLGMSFQAQSFQSPPSDIDNSERSLPNANSFLAETQQKSFENMSPLPSTISTSLAHFLPSYANAKLQQSLQEKFASINVGKNEVLVRSHSDENLQQKFQKDKNEVIQHNPFMGTLANANSVPCVYVESSTAENYDYKNDSPTNIDSPSTSASYASSPPSVRPYWIEDDGSLREYVFREWPMEGPTGGTNAQEAGKSGPVAHHRSLTDLSAIPEVTELVTSNRTHQLSLPSVAMTDLTVDEQFDKGGSPSDFLLPPDVDFDMEQSVMDSLLKSDVPDLHPYDLPMLMTEANALASEVLLSASPDAFLRTEYNAYR